MANDKNPPRENARRYAPSTIRALVVPALVVPAVLGALSLAPAAGAESSDRFHITAQERAACTSDAIRFCMHTYPDEDQLLACMKQNRDALTATCRVAFDAGVKRRKL